MKTLYVGVDMAKDSFTAAAWVKGRVLDLGEFANDAAGFAALQTQVAPHVGPGKAALILEPTAGYELSVAYAAYQQGWKVSLPNPWQIRRWAQGQGTRAKTDRVDARVLAEFGYKQKPPCWKPMATEASELESLLEREKDLLQQLQQEHNRKQILERKPHVPEAVHRSVEQMIGALEEALREVREAMKAHLAAHEGLKEDARLLQSVPGVGEKNVWWLLVQLYRWKALTHGKGHPKSLTSYTGLDPVPYESGTSVRRPGAISRKGDPEVRKMLYMGALGALRSKGALRVFYDGLVKRGKPKKLALVAASRKILIWSWLVLQRRVPFDPSLHPRVEAAPA